MLRFAEEMDEQIVASIIAAASALVANTGAIAQQHNENFINFVTEAAAVDEDEREKGDLATFNGRKSGSMQNIDRGPCQWFADYLSENPTYDRCRFRRRFRIPLSLYRRLHEDLLRVFPEEFSRKAVACGRRGHETFQKILVSLRRLGSARRFDDLDDSARMSEESSRQATRTFVKRVIELYGPRYLNRRPSSLELHDVSAKHEKAGVTVRGP
jgi:hypothetical protein